LDDRAGTEFNCRFAHGEQVEKNGDRGALGRVWKDGDGGGLTLPEGQEAITTTPATVCG